MSFHHLLTIAQRLQSLITKLFILYVGLIVFVYFLIFDREKKKQNEHPKFIKCSDSKPSQLVAYTRTSRNLKINLVEGSILFSTWSQKFDFQDIQQLKSVEIDPKLLIYSPVHDLSNRLIFRYTENEIETKNKLPMRYSMIVSLQENLLIQRMNKFVKNDE